MNRLPFPDGRIFAIRSLSLMILGFFVGSTRQAHAAITFYADSPSFQAAAAGPILSQNFNSTNLGATESISFTSPLDATNTGPLDAGSVLPGLTIISAASPRLSDLALFGPNSALGTTPLSLDNYIILPNFGGALIVEFGPGVTAASLNLVAFAARNVDISIFSPSQTLLGNTTVVAPDSGAGQFFGVIATGGDAIGSLSFTTGTDGLVGLEQVQFNTTEAIPEPSSIVMLGIAVAGSAIGYRRRAAHTA